MKIENEIFKRCQFDYDRLLDYGFKKEHGQFTYSKEIMNGSFRVDILVTKDGKISGTIYDLSFGEEYTNYRTFSQTGEFTSHIRREYENLLQDIKSYATKSVYFMSEQANRITEWIQTTYQDLPQFAWEKFPGYGVFKNSSNQKWYGLIANIKKSKLDYGEEEVEIINLKLDPEKIKELQKKKGFYPAYHMNKKNWISILLDRSLDDEEIESYIEESHRFTEK